MKGLRPVGAGLAIGARVVPFGRDAIAAPADQPEHADQVEDSGTEPSEKSVFGLAREAPAVIHQFFADIPSRPLDQCRQEPMHGGEIGQIPEGGGADQFPASARIRRIILQDEAAHTIGDA